MKGARTTAHRGEAIVLRSWPFGEADLMVSLLTRDEGKLRGVARHAMKSRRRFGGALEPGTCVNANWAVKRGQDIVRLDSFEIVWSPLRAPMDGVRLAGLQLVCEALEEVLPDGAVDDNGFRLAVASLTAMGACRSDDETVAKTGQPERGTVVWLPVLYFCLWMSRLMGWMPALGHCAVCGLDLRGQAVWWSAAADGVTCAEDARADAQRLIPTDVAEAARIFRSPLEALMTEPWPRERSRGLRQFAFALLERHIERRLRSAASLH